MEIKFCWHVHHKRLLEPLTEPLEDRIAYIKKAKPPEEQETRLRLLRLVVGKLPVAIYEVGRAFVEAHQVRREANRVYEEADQIYRKAIQVYEEASREEASREEALRVYREAFRVYKEAERVDEEVSYALIVSHRVEVEALHKKECPNCPWDGDSIFPPWR